MSEFLRMGGYGLYVWTAYGAALVVLALNLAVPIVRRRRLVRELGGNSAPRPDHRAGPSADMTRRQRRAMLVGAMVAGLGTATALALLAIGENMLWFFTPSQLLAEGPPTREPDPARRARRRGQRAP